MPLHRLTHVTIGVPNVEDVAAYYADFGLDETTNDVGGRLIGQPQTRRFRTVDAGEQLRIVRTPSRRLVEMGVAVSDPDDLDRIALQLSAIGTEYRRDHEKNALHATDKASGVAVVAQVLEPLVQAEAPRVSYNGPGRIDRPDVRAPGVDRTGAVRPRRLGHVVIGSTDQQNSEKFFAVGLGLKISDRVPGLASFLRCSTDHHNVLVQQAPISFLHHTAWEVDDVDEVGRGATAMLEADASRHVWGLGRHHVGSNFFWYLRDPAGNFSEYYSDLDCIVDEQLWKPGVWEGARGLYNWGPPPPPSFVHPEDLADLMTGSHTS
jgi:catechol 2,3-dioxygenase-like lactoylglutathione lyase family enzyme